MNEIYLRLASIFPFFVPAIKDYIDVLNTTYDSVLGNINLIQVLQQSFLYLGTSIKFSILYFLSFQWIQDLTYLPILVPQLKLEILKEHFFLQTPQSNFFSFLEIPSYLDNKFFLGFLNSFFLCLPLSVAHIISTRRLLIQGLAAGIFSNLGTICGQIVLLICILFGGRFFITPWFNFQTLNYFFGFCLVFNIVYDMGHERSIRIIDISNTSLLLRIFLLNFTLAWTEQSCIFQYFGNLTLGAEPTIIEIFSSPTELQSILAHTNYIFGIIAGSFLFTGIFIFTCLKMSNFIVKVSAIRYSWWIRRLNFGLITLIIAFTFTSIPFYSFDYLVLSNLGFVSQDKSLKDTIFSSTKIYDRSKLVLGDPNNRYIDKKPGIDTDVSLFDKGRYLMFDVDDSFEQLNYQGEYAWLTHRHKTPRISRDPSSFRILSRFSKFFDKLRKISSSARRQSLAYSNNLISEQNKKKSIQHNLNRKKPETTSFDSENFNDNEILELEGNKSTDVLSSRRAKQKKVNKFFENLINISVQKRFLDEKLTPMLTREILEKRFKQKYYSNPIYKLLLLSDIDLFLARQPRSFALTAKQEKKLFEKRLILANYYDSLRYYNSLPYKDEFQDVFYGSKSYADRIYNHQFKGTLKIIRRLFSISLNNVEDTKTKNSSETQNFYFPNNTENFILKFDQPLYKKENTSTAQNKIYTTSSQNKNKGGFHSLYSKNEKFHPVFHEESYKNKKILNKENNLEYTDPFIRITNPIPFYVGWDEQLRKLVITNRLAPKYSTGYSMKFFTKNNNDYSTLKKNIQKNKTIEFTTWPIPKHIVKNQKQKSTLSYNFLFDSLNNSQNKVLLDTLKPVPKTRSELQKLKSIPKTNEGYKILQSMPKTIDVYGKIESIPINIEKNAGKGQAKQKMQDIMPYTRGGFIWPGHSPLKFQFKNLT